MTNFKTAEDYLRNKYGAYRGSFSWRDEEKAFNAGLQSQASVIAQLEAELADARKDQARYQWIRNESWAMYNYNKGKPHLVTFDSLQSPTHLAEDAVDQAIDAAIKEQGK